MPDFCHKANELTDRLNSNQAFSLDPLGPTKKTTHLVDGAGNGSSKRRQIAAAQPLRTSQSLAAAGQLP